jgi:LysR family transcriptional regulator, carnitine catabolism transcriptional activator
MHLTVRQLEVLVAAADAPTFTEAARNLGISQPSLSEAVRRMESELGASLFDRSTRSVVLTADGRHTVAVAREMLREFRLGLESIADRSRARRARVTIASLPSVACAVLPPAVRGLLLQHQGTEIALHDVLHERAIALVRDGIADLAVTVRPAALDGLDFADLGADALHLVCRRDHGLAAKRRPVWRDFAGQPFVALARTSSVRRLTDAAFVHAGVALEPAYEAEQIPSAAAFVEAGLGVTALPGLTLAMVKGTGLIARPIGGPQMRRQIGIATLAGRTMSPAAASLVSHLRRSFAKAARTSH